MGIDAPDAKLNDFMTQTIGKLWQQYCMSRDALRARAVSAIQDAGVRVPNGTKGALFPDNTITLPDNFTRDYRFDGLEGIGLAAEPVDEHTFRITGRPASAGDYDITISCDYDGRLDDEPRAAYTFRLIINPDPRSLWKDIPTNRDIPYFKPDAASQYIKVPQGRDVVAASRRGRSHANEGKPRDDDFGIRYLNESGWYILSVCDGAGSAAYSRKGAELACASVTDFCSNELSHPEELEKAISAYVSAEDKSEATRAINNLIYSILGGAAFKAHRDITAMSKSAGIPLKDFSTTLLLAVCKKFDFGWFVATYWVGDGALAIYDRPSHRVRIMGVPDEGEYSGQTRFLTMPDLFRNAQEIQSRLRFALEPEFTALTLMSDGVSDPMFETDVRLNDPAEWDKFFDRLHEGFPDDGIPGVDLRDDDPNCAEQMLVWLDFWSKGNHDDRTLVILY